ncbi:MAG: hypothetical protein Q8N63_07995 [Nanoarchaeota archaeon]|nr:hypothetical protein [Nanoarchaeota archaeon]
MKIKKTAGFLLIAIGIFIIIIQPFSTTGAVIDLSASLSRIWFFVGLGILTVGAILFINFGGESNQAYKFRPLSKIIEEGGKDPDIVFVLDSSGAIDYKPEIGTLFSEMKGKVYVPREVIRELEKNPRNTRMLREEFTDDNILQIDPTVLKQRGFYRQLRGVRTHAKRALAKTEKHVIYRHLRDIINNNDKKPDDMHEDDYADYKKEMEKLDNALRNKYDLEPNTKNRMWLLKKHVRANPGDLAVLSNALLLAGRGGKKAKIFARDSHLREAVESLTAKYPSLKKSLEYIGYSEKDEDDY